MSHVDDWCDIFQHSVIHKTVIECRLKLARHVASDVLIRISEMSSRRGGQSTQLNFVQLTSSSRHSYSVDSVYVTIPHMSLRKVFAGRHFQEFSRVVQSLVIDPTGKSIANGRQLLLARRYAIAVFAVDLCLSVVCHRPVL